VQVAPEGLPDREIVTSAVMQVTGSRCYSQGRSGYCASQQRFKVEHCGVEEAPHDPRSLL
jgi:hypothetical protein